jgi:hypothetical protein
MNPIYGPPVDTNDCEDLRLECVTTCVGFDDLLDVTLTLNHAHVDTMIVVTSHDDRRTQAVAHKHGAVCVQTDLFRKNGRKFNKGAAINAGMDWFQYKGWRLHLDADMVLPDNFRRMLFNHTHLDKDTLYGADRVNVIGRSNIKKVLETPQHLHRALVEPPTTDPIGARFVCPLNGYLPLGFFQLWHARCQKDYPYSLGTAAHDDTMFAAQWPRSKRAHLPTVVCYQLCPAQPEWGMNWNGRTSPRLKD